MARAYGSNAHLLMKRETVYGQAATGDYIRMPFMVLEPRRCTGARLEQRSASPAASSTPSRPSPPPTVRSSMVPQPEPHGEPVKRKRENLAQPEGVLHNPTAG